MGGWSREEFELRPMHLKAIDLLMMKGMRAHGGVGREEPSAQRAQARIGCEIRAAAISTQLTFLDTAYFLACAIAWAFAPLTASRNGPAAAGAATRPSSVARVVTRLPYMARLDWLSARTNAPLNVAPRKAPLARE